jgi:hypothetical protein
MPGLFFTLDKRNNRLSEVLDRDNGGFNMIHADRVKKKKVGLVGQKLKK